jgi:hypothetical protein
MSPEGFGRRELKKRNPLPASPTGGLLDEIEANPLRRARGYGLYDGKYDEGFQETHGR